jgi:hypothetical protein
MELPKERGDSLLARGKSREYEERDLPPHTSFFLSVSEGSPEAERSRRSLVIDFLSSVSQRPTVKQPATLDSRPLTKKVVNGILVP